MNLKQVILDKTRGGLDILLRLYPDAANVVDGRARKFKMRPEERTASATIRQKDGIWWVCDFGGEGREKNAFDAYMQEEHLAHFSEALHRLAAEYDVDIRLSPDINKAEVTFEDVNESEAKEGDFAYKAKDKPSDADLKVWGPFVTQETLEQYHYLSLAYYSTVYRRKDTGRLVRRTVNSSANFPIFLHECGEFQKIYCPLACDGKQPKFFYKGTKPANYIYGLDELTDAYKAHIKHAEENDDADKRLDGVCLCSGERDAMNVAGMGYYPIWLNSETATLPAHTYNSLRHMAKKIYNIPDIDTTGIARGNLLALEYMDIYTVELPKWLLTYKDYRGKARKDLRDFLELRPDKKEFEAMIGTAMQAQFWQVTYPQKRNGSIEEKIGILSYNLLYFLRINGFYKLKDPISGETRPCRIKDYKVETVEPKQVRDFVRTELARRRVRNSIMEAYINSKKATQTIYDDLDTIEIQYDISTPDSRTLFFDNCVLQVYKDKVVRVDARTYKGYCYKDKVIPHKYKELPPAFHISEDGYFIINHTDSKVFCYLLNGSRMYWQEELEMRATGDEATDKDYARNNKYTIYGSRLTQEEQTEQLRHLMNKIYTYGFLLHHFKREDMAKCVWVMESKLVKEDESSGGSGKSLFMRILHHLHLASIVTLDGRTLDVNANTHFLDRVTPQTDLLFIDDASKTFPFEAFYGIVTGQVPINPKGTKSFEIDYKESPQVVISSNFPWRGDDRSTMRRLLPVVYSDYYHDKKPDDDYKGVHKVSDDFDGRCLFGHDYSEEEYNADYNFMINCIQFYLQHQREDFLPPMERVLARVRRNIMGDNFVAWADVYFSQDENGNNENLDKLLLKRSVYEDWMDEVGRDLKVKSIQSFKTKLKIWCQERGYEFCPQEIPDCKMDGRIIKNIYIDGKRRSMEFIYIRTSADKPIDLSLPARYM